MSALFGLLIGLFIVVVIGVALIFSMSDSDVEDDQEEDGDVVPRLIADLSGDPEHDLPIQNRLLALGARTIPDFIHELNHCMGEMETTKASRVARIEETVADFGLTGLPIVARHLERCPTGSAIIPSLLRVLSRLGEPGAATALRFGLNNPWFVPYVPRLARALPDAYFVSILNRAKPTDLPFQLDVLSAVILRRAELLSSLWVIADSGRRVIILKWASRWVNLMPVELVLTALSDRDDSVAIEAARVARLLVDPRLVVPLVELLRRGEDCQTPAVRALSAQCTELATPGLIQATRMAEHAAGLLAASYLLKDSRSIVPSIVGDSPHLKEFLANRGAENIGSLSDLELDWLSDAIESDEDPVRVFAAQVLASRAKDDPRCRERLILTADSGSIEARVESVSALARIGDSAAPELLVRVACSQNIRSQLLSLQEAAQHIGPSLVTALVKRLRAGHKDRIDNLTTILRTITYESALPALLRAMDEVRDPTQQLIVASTCKLIECDGQARISDRVSLTERGLLVPALRYLMIFGEPDDLPLLSSIHEQHPSLRSLTACVIDSMGAPAIDTLRRRVAQGGDDFVLLAIEYRLAILEECHAGET